MILGLQAVSYVLAMSKLMISYFCLFCRAVFYLVLNVQEIFSGASIASETVLFWGEVSGFF